MKVKVEARSISRGKPETLVVLGFKTNSKKGEDGKEKPAQVNFWCPSKSIEEKLKSAVSDKVFEGNSGEALMYRDIGLDGYQNVMAFGMGDASRLSSGTFRRAGAQLVKALKGAKSEVVGVWFNSKLPKSVGFTGAGQAFAEGVHLGIYQTLGLKSEEKTAHPLKELEVLVDNKTHENQTNQGIKTAEVVAECVNLARRLGDFPGNMMTPAILAKEAQSAAKGTSISVEIWDGARIKKEKMGGLFGVSLGSSEDPKFISMEYWGASKKQTPICFVGKGLTFDSGGISLKPGQGMEEMKFDMCGGANVIATIVAIAKLKLKVNVLCYVPASENMPGPSANKPGDIFTARNGKTVEVNNTDAEGRLILADALAYASEKKPSVIIDAATLTGAMTMALGDTHTGYFTRNEKLAKALESAASKADERVWRLPLIDEHGDDMKGAYADYSNISSNKGAGSAKGAAFLEFFVEKGIPWAHFDIAGTAWNIGHRYPYHPTKGASGVMIRTFVEFAQNWKG